MSIAKKLAGGGSAFSGLSAAKGSAAAAGAAAEARSEALGRARKASSVPLAEVVFNPRNPRKTYSEEKIEETAASLRERGQVTAITVVSRMAFLDAHPDDEELLGDASFVALDGNRRLRAAARAGLEKIRVDLQDDLAPTASAMLEAALIANIHREDVPPIEEAEAIRELLETVYDGNQAAVARRLGKTAAWVGQRLALLHLVPEVQEMVESKELGVKEARRLGAATRAGTLPREEQVAKAREVRERPRAATVARPRTEPDVNPVYPAAGSAASTDPASEPGVNPVYTGDGPHSTGAPVGTEASGRPPLTLAVDPDDPEGFAVSIRLATTPRQAAAVARALIELLDSEHNTETVAEPA